MGIAVCLISGGLDSCVSAAVARAEGHTLAFLHVGYGQLTQQREARAFHELADIFRADFRLSVQAEHLSRIGGSSLTDSTIELPPADLDRRGIPSTYVPFRNANLLCIAASWGEVLGAHRLYIGAVEEDSSGYPDCRAAFFDAFNALIRAGTRPDTQLETVTPLIHLNKGQIVRLGVELEAPLHLTWSCYRNSELACGKCDSCALRLRGFAQAGIPDPISYTPSG